MSEKVLEFAGVEICYDEEIQLVAAGVSFEIEKGERAALLGLNGSGKTTLLKAAAGLIPHEGRIRICGIDLSKRSVSDLRRKIGFLFNSPEDQLLFPKAIDDVSFGLRQLGVSASDATSRSLKVMGELGIAYLANEPLHHLSHGTKQKMALAGALVTEPPLLLLDEPSASLDPSGKRELKRYLLEQRSAMLIATHDLGFASELCNRYLLLENGKVAYDGTDIDAIKNRWE